MLHKADALKLVNIDTQDIDRVTKLFFDGIEQRMHGTAWPAPCGIEIDQHQSVTCRKGVEFVESHIQKNKVVQHFLDNLFNYYANHLDLNILAE